MDRIRSLLGCGVGAWALLACSPVTSVREADPASASERSLVQSLTGAGPVIQGVTADSTGALLPSPSCNPLPTFKTIGSAIFYIKRCTEGWSVPSNDFLNGGNIAAYYAGSLVGVATADADSAGIVINSIPAGSTVHLVANPAVPQFRFQYWIVTGGASAGVHTTPELTVFTDGLVRVRGLFYRQPGDGGTGGGGGGGSDPCIMCD